MRSKSALPGAKEYHTAYPGDIRVGPRMRDINEDTVQKLVDSIQKIGLQTPLTVTYHEQGITDYYQLVAGNHRLQAAIKLGLPLVDVIVVKDDLSAKLWKIAENLHRAELTVQERAEHIADWVKLADANKGASCADIPKAQVAPSGHTGETIEKLIAGNEKAMLAWDRAIRGAHGGNRNPDGRNQHSERDNEVKTDNVSLDLPDKKRSLDHGNSSQGGLRRLEKAAEAGDGNATDMLSRVLDPNDPMTVNGACIAMGWRISFRPIPRLAFL